MVVLDPESPLELAVVMDLAEVTVVGLRLDLGEEACITYWLRPEPARATTPSASRSPAMTPNADLLNIMVVHYQVLRG